LTSSGSAAAPSPLLERLPRVGRGFAGFSACQPPPLMLLDLQHIEI